MTLTKGQLYDVAALTLTGWTTGDGTGHEGYQLAAYFRANGCYLGPDAHGIEPIIESGEREIASAAKEMGARGGKARAARMTKAERVASGKHAIAARWAKRKTGTP